MLSRFPIRSGDQIRNRLVGALTAAGVGLTFRKSCDSDISRSLSYGAPAFEGLLQARIRITKREKVWRAMRLGRVGSGNAEAEHRIGATSA
jgi:hypothetical protein